MILKRPLSHILHSLRLLAMLLFLSFAGYWLTRGESADGQTIQIPRPNQIAADRVLVVLNRRSEDSTAIANYYIQKRHIPRANVCTISCPTGEECTRHEYDAQIEAYLSAFLANRSSIDFIVLTKGIPIRTAEGQQGVDSLLASLGAPDRKDRMPNPYFNKMERFTFEQYHFRLVTRLDGYTRQQCLKLVDNALAARPKKGPFLLHAGPGHEDGGYKMVNDSIKAADILLKARGFETAYDTKDAFPGNVKNLMGYYSWGSNDLHFDKPAYNSLGFVPGAIAETVVSTSGRTFSDPKASGQSLIGDLIAQGVTGCKGYVSEPYADAIAVASLLFDRYTGGFSLAESFYMASRYLTWKDVVIGDPLCAPYALQNK